MRDLEHSLPLKLLRARELAMARFRPMLRQHGLTEQQWRVIRVLAQEDGIDVTTLAERSLLLAPSLTRILQWLEREGFVERASDPGDQRRATILLTRAGEAKFDAVGPDSEALYTEIETRFGTTQLTHLYELLSQFEAAFDEHPAS